MSSCGNGCLPTGEMAESRAKRVRIKEMDGWTLGLLVDYIYTAEIQVTEDNVQVNAHKSIHSASAEIRKVYNISIKLFHFIIC